MCQWEKKLARDMANVSPGLQIWDPKYTKTLQIWGSKSGKFLDWPLEELQGAYLKEKGRKVPELCRSDSGYSRVLLPFEEIKKHVARPLSPSIARKRKMCLKKEVKWRDLSLKVPTRGFWFKKETRWRDLSANFFHCGAAWNLIAKGSRVAQPSCHLIV